MDIRRELVAKARETDDPDTANLCRKASECLRKLENDNRRMREFVLETRNKANAILFGREAD